MPPRPVALPACLPFELLTYTLQHSSYPTTVIICSSKSEFLSSLNESLPRNAQQPQSPPTHITIPEDVVEAEPEPEAQESLQQSTASYKHSLLQATLHQISLSRHISLIFIPSVSHLRAYLSVFPSTSARNPAVPASPLAKLQEEHTKLRRNQPLLVVYGLLDLHRDTSEWSVQGLGTSLAEVVEAGCRGMRKAILVERMSDSVGEDQREHSPLEAGNGVGAEMDRELGGIEEDALRQRGREETAIREEGIVREGASYREQAWRERLPMLNKSVRRQLDGNDAYGDTWMGRTVEVGAVMSRWFNFAEEAFWED